MATVYLPDGGSYDDGQPDYQPDYQLDRTTAVTGSRGSDAPTLGTMPVPNLPAPTPAPAPAPLSGNPTKTAGGYVYDWRPEPYQDPLNNTDIEQQRMLGEARKANPRLAADDAGALAALSGAGIGPSSAAPVPFQFNDPYTKQLEELGQRALQSFTQPNPQVQQVMDFLNKRFGELSTSNGYSPDELAVLRTQALEPIEANRAASQQRVLERSSARGMLPSSGLVQDEQRTVDRDFDKLRTAADRDLAINSINERGRRQGEAVNLGQLGISIPQQQNAQALNVGQMLYNLPRQAMLDAQSVVNGSAPQNMISPYIQLLQQQQQQDLIRQQQDAQYWSAIGQQIAGLFK